ncbi:hypothetical protein SAMN05443248_7930 [Bradyrhizobium erythrophlei]|uniref:Uncharacterized protein n=1 Tax=Bradyrhizobium erythrophlei TaxID=1437360 RepID=A0A1M5Y5S6_9BRAD|nr:hypothetical protein SAMN05443248_7930 [Bradyrhizobium erythrophlei]
MTVTSRFGGAVTGGTERHGTKALQRPLPNDKAPRKREAFCLFGHARAWATRCQSRAARRRAWAYRAAGWIHVGVGAAVRARSGACGASAAANRASAGSSRAGTRASGAARSGTSAATRTASCSTASLCECERAGQRECCSQCNCREFHGCLPWLVTKNKSQRHLMFLLVFSVLEATLPQR